MPARGLLILGGPRDQHNNDRSGCIERWPSTDDDLLCSRRAATVRRRGLAVLTRWSVAETLLPAWAMRRVKRFLPDPFHPRFHQLKCIFIHIPKCAGMSVSEGLFGGEVGHRPARWFELYDKERFQSYFKFTFVRNPWDRLVSAFFYLKQGGMTPQDKTWAGRHLARFDTFDAFVRSLVDPKFRRVALAWPHFAPQLDYIRDCSGRICVDYCGRVESFSRDYDRVCSILGVPARVRDTNRSSHDEYYTYYTRESVEIVRDVYREDVAAFNYEFRE